MSIEKNDLMHVGPGTLMGKFMREYWLPGLVSTELVADGDPVRFKLLGEHLIAFRDSSGKVGVMDHRCPHRCASLFLGRNEQNGLRCVYHGWKFDTDGNCVEQPNVPVAWQAKQKVRAKAYRVQERGGVVWVYMGESQQSPPPFPQLEILLAPDHEIGVQFVHRSCNYLQSLEGDIDTSHFGFLHAGHVELDDVPFDHPIRSTLTNRAPEYHVADTPWGTSYGAYRDGESGGTYWRFANFIFPFWTQQPQGEFSENVHVRGWVPLDDDNCMWVNLYWQRGDVQAARPRAPLKSGKLLGGETLDFPYLPNTTEWLGRWRMKAQPENDWLIDRRAQRENEIYSGISNLHLQDQAVTESMGPIVDHSLEHLCPSDLMVARTRRRLLQAAKSFVEGKAPAPGSQNPEIFRDARSGFFTTNESVPWQQLYAEHLKQAVRIEAQPQAAE
jgi:phthalate 4,5-dioxygenase oxygenase subunit